MAVRVKGFPVRIVAPVFQADRLDRILDDRIKVFRVIAAQGINERRLRVLHNVFYLFAEAGQKFEKRSRAGF
jgi:hypothetical protein